MMNSKPTGAGKVATDRWKATNRVTIEIFKAYWQNVSPHLLFPGTKAGDDATYYEWEEKKYGDTWKHYGTRNVYFAKHGIVRIISKYYWINEATYFEDKPHGLWFAWNNNKHPAFEAGIYDHGEEKARIWWNSDWSEGYSDNKELILSNGINLFKP